MSSGAIGKAISNIHSNLYRSLAYITNSTKTEEQLLVGGINCYNPEDFKITGDEFKEVYNRFSKEIQTNKKPILAHHYMISFDPKNNVEPHKAHEYSMKIMKRFLKKEYQVVLSTHIDKESHIHTHVIFNTYNKNTGKKYESSPAKLREFKKIINDVCLEHNLNIINKPISKEKTVNLNYKEWLISKNIIDDKKINRFDYIRQAIKSVLKDGTIKDLDKLSQVLKEKYNLIIVYKSYKTNELYKNITFKSDDWEKGIRGKFDVSLENILARLQGRNVESNKFEEYCVENDTTEQTGYIKKAIDTELKNNISLTSVEDLAEILKRKYNIEMKYASTAGTYLKRFKFKALDSKKIKYIGSASLDKDNRDNYELKGIGEKIGQIQETKFGLDIKENLKILNNNLLKSGKFDRWGISTGLNYMTKNNLRTSPDINIRYTKLKTIKNKNSSEIDKIDEYMKQMELIYNRLKKKMIEIKSLEKEVSEIGMFNVKKKKELLTKIDNINVDIDKLKSSEFYQKEMKYSEKSEKLREEKNENISILKKCDNESELLYNIETIDTNKENILERLKLDEQKEQEQEQQREKNFKKNLGIDLLD